MAEDQELLTSWRAGDRAAGEALLARHFDTVCRFFHNKVGDDAPDLIQQTFLALCESQERFRGEAPFRSYLLGMARNVLLAHFRRKRKQAERFDPLEHSVADQQTSFTTELARRREQQILLQALRSLPLALQIVFELYHLEGLTAGELAAMHGISEPGMYGRLRKARLLTIAACEKLAETPALRESTIGHLDDWARELRAQLGGRLA
nr:sigma-70 family RNA polymerase sigma factor [Nannocystis sp.]